MDNKYKENVEILRYYLDKELPIKEAAGKKYSLQELKALQYQQHLEQLEPIIYKEQE